MLFWANSTPPTIAVIGRTDLVIQDGAIGRQERVVIPPSHGLSVDVDHQLVWPAPLPIDPARPIHFL